MSRRVKDMLISEITARLGDVKDVLVVDCSRMDAVSANAWRNGIAKSSISALTVKNSVARNALSRIGVAGLDDVLAGPSTLIWGGEDVVALSREIAAWSRQFKGLEIKGGTVEGQSLDRAGVEKLSKSPGRLELISQISGLMLSPGRQLAGAMCGPGSLIAGALKTIADGEE